MLEKHLGTNVKDVITSAEINEYPLLICLSFNEGEVTIVDVIKGSMSSNDTLQRLHQARFIFDSRIMSPKTGHQQFW